MVIMSFNTSFRPAIAMIELIFALVIMGIVMMSAPMLIGTATSSTYVALQQEGINEAASRVNMIMGYAWDENDTNVSFVPPILTVTAGHVDLNEIMGLTPTGRRIGTPLLSQRTFLLSSGADPDLNASTLGADANDAGTPDDIDDFGGTTLVLGDGAGAAAAAVDYVEDSAAGTIGIATVITYVADAPVAAGAGWYSQNTLALSPAGGAGVVGTSNIKAITVRLTSAHADAALSKTIVLQAFSCNIGGHDLKERF